MDTFPPHPALLPRSRYVLCVRNENYPTSLERRKLSVHLLTPHDEGVLDRIQTIKGLPVVCNPQLYLDLVHYPARGREQADELRRQTLGY